MGRAAGRVSRSPRLREIVSVISAFAVFVHAAVGCCAHHAHAEIGPAGCQRHHGLCDGREFAGHEHEHAEADGDDHNIAAENSENGDEHGPSQGACEGTRCLGIRGAKAAGLDTAVGAWVLLCIAPLAELTGRDGVEASSHLGDSFAPPVRRHLAHCVLLI